MSAYSKDEVAQWLRRLDLPRDLRQFIEEPKDFPKTIEALTVLMRCQITTFPYENLSVHYSPAHAVDIKPRALYEKLLGENHRRRGGYCLELSLLFHHMLRGLGFQVYATGVRNRTRTKGVPGGDYKGWSHLVNIVNLPSGKKFSVDVGFGGDGPTRPLPMNDDGAIFQNLGSQQMRLVHDTILGQQLNPQEQKLWIYQWRNGQDKEWNATYSFGEYEFFYDDFEVVNWWASTKTLHRWTVIAVRFLREGEDPLFEARTGKAGGEDVKVGGKVMLVDDELKVNMGGRTTVVRTFGTEEGRVEALWDYFGIELTEEERSGIDGWDQRLR